LLYIQFLQIKTIVFKEIHLFFMGVLKLIVWSYFDNKNKVTRIYRIWKNSICRHQQKM